jgi:signal transduction histidine kinase
VEVDGGIKIAKNKKVMICTDS